MVGAVILTNALPAFAQTTPAPSPMPSANASPAASPFVPPANWVQLPRGFTLTELKNLWQGPKKGTGRGGFFGQAVLPIPAGIVGAGLAQLRSALAHSKTPLNARTTPVKMCGGTASVSTVRFGKGTNAAVIETTVLSKGGPTYATVYARPNGGPVNSVIETAIRNSCPLPSGDLPDATPPAGWSALQKGLDFELAGVWLGNAPLQIFTILQGHGIPSPDMIADMFQPVTVSKKGQVQYRVATHRVKFCGQPGLLVNTQFNVPPGFGLSYDIAAVQGTTATYILSYFHPSDFNDPAAQQSLQTLCGGPVPLPSGTPAALPRAK